ncbi:hypothetical protein B0H13DRAFT_1902521 [Mycena leptocephala]|nr:hypothetical protein B0H13DRAFT_1902521 [Mycena leptocephala]
MPFLPDSEVVSLDSSNNQSFIVAFTVLLCMGHMDDSAKISASSIVSFEFRLNNSIPPISLHRIRIALYAATRRRRYPPCPACVDVGFEVECHSRFATEIESLRRATGSHLGQQVVLYKVPAHVWRGRGASNNHQIATKSGESLWRQKGVIQANIAAYDVIPEPPDSHQVGTALNIMGLFQRALVQPLHEQQLAPINSHATFVAPCSGPHCALFHYFTLSLSIVRPADLLDGLAKRLARMSEFKFGCAALMAWACTAWACPRYNKYIHYVTATADLSDSLANGLPLSGV